MKKISSADPYGPALVEAALGCVCILELSFLHKDPLCFSACPERFCSGLFFGGDTMNDEDYMRLALQLAKKGCGWTSPNPMVGAVVVKEGRIIGQGWHQKYGQAHAERNALASCTEDPQGATMYVTLEPCCHYGKQPPCVDAILDAGIHRVVVGSADPNPLVAGKGIAILRAHGIDVTENVLQEECDALNKGVLPLYHHKNAPSFP